MSNSADNSANNSADNSADTSNEDWKSINNLTNAELKAWEPFEPSFETPRSIFPISDIHTEFYDSAQDAFNAVRWGTATHLVLAGDIGNVSIKSKIYN